MPSINECPICKKVFVDDDFKDICPECVNKYDKLKKLFKKRGF